MSHPISLHSVNLATSKSYNLLTIRQRGCYLMCLSVFLFTTGLLLIRLPPFAVSFGVQPRNHSVVSISCQSRYAPHLTPCSLERAYHVSTITGATWYTTRVSLSQQYIWASFLASLWSIHTL
jgi:hypothetical protein